MIASRLFIMCALVGTLYGCSTVERRPDPVVQLAASGLSVDERDQMLSVVFTALVRDLHESDLPAYLTLGKHSDPAPTVIEAVRGQGLRIEPQSAQPPFQGNGDGIVGTLVSVERFERLAPERVIVETGVMAGILAGTGHRFTLSKVGGDWRIDKRELTWIS